jgi:hypothetical protein
MIDIKEQGIEIMSDSFDSKYGLDTMNDEALLEGVVIDITLLNLFYESPSFAESKLDFGGGIYSIPCRAVIKVSGNNPTNLAKILGLPTNKTNKDMMKDILEGCKVAMTDAAYLS